LTDSAGTLRPMLRLALPVLTERLLSMLVVYSDQCLTGWYLERPHLAAMNLMVYVLWMLTELFVFITVPATAMVARFVGARDFELANRVAQQAFVLGAALAILATVAGLTLSDSLVRLMQLEGESAELAGTYMRIVLPLLPLIMCEAVGNACLRGAGDTVTGLIAMTLTNIVNVLLSWGLMLGWGPLPRLGWAGIAWGTAAGYSVGGAFILYRLLRGRAGLRLSLRRLSPDFPLIRRMLRIGLPGGSDIMSILLCQLVFVAIINQLGDLAAAAHGVAIRIESLAYLPGSAFQVAAATLAGQYLGAGKPRQAGRSVAMACAVGGGLMTAAGVLFFAAAEPLTALFLRPDQQAVREQAVVLLRIVAIAMPPLALTMILSGALRGAGDTVWPLMFSWIGYLGVRIPGGYLLAHTFGLGVEGAWYAMAADLTLRGALVTARFFHGGWKQVRV
jgi:putative MATE family efflux protein